MISPVSLWIIKRALFGGNTAQGGGGGGAPASMSMMNIPGAPSLPKIPNVTRGAESGRTADAPSSAIPETTEGAGRTGAKTRDPASSPQNMSPTIAAQPGISNTMPPGPGP